MKENKSIEKLQVQMQNLLSRIKTKEERIALLETIPVVKEYNVRLNDVEYLKKEYQDISKKYEKLFCQECPHPIWYLENYSYDLHFETPIEDYGCRCVRCNSFSVLCGNEFWRSDDEYLFERNKAIYSFDASDEMTQSEIPYEVIREEFLALESEGYSFDEIREILFQKYTEKNEDLARNLKIKYSPRKDK